MGVEEEDSVTSMLPAPPFWKMVALALSDIHFPSGESLTLIVSSI